MQYTIEIVKSKLSSDQRWIEQAIVKLYDFQTADEQASDETKHENGVGFNAFDAKVLSYYATWLKRGNHLNGKHLDKAKKMVPKYAKQILHLINQKSS